MPDSKTAKPTPAAPLLGLAPPFPEVVPIRATIAGRALRTLDQIHQRLADFDAL